MIEWLASPQTWIALMTLTSLEIVLGVDNVIFISILALSFLLLVGVSLMADGLGQHISKGYIYFAMAFSVFVEVLNLRVRRRMKPVELRHPYTS